MRRFFSILLAALREIFDESAYQRYLQRTGQASSRAAYAGFMSEHGAGKCKRPKCC